MGGPQASPNTFPMPNNGISMHGFNQSPQFSPPFSGPPHMAYGQPPSASPFNQQWSPPGPAQSSGPPPNAPGMNPGLPQPSPGLPQRPAFQAPNLSKEEMAKMHAGFQGPPAHQQSHPPTQQQQQPPHSQQRLSNDASNAPATRNGSNSFVPSSDDIDDLIRSVTSQAPPAKTDDKLALAAQIKQEEAASTGNAMPDQVPSMLGLDGTSDVKPEPAVIGATTSTTTPAPSTPAPAPPAKKSKKNKDGEASKLVWSDDVTSPEEKMARQPRYAFDRGATEKTEFVRGEISGQITAETDDTVKDPQDAHPM